MNSGKIICESGPYGQQLVRLLSEKNQLIQYQMYLMTRHRPDYLLPCYLRFRGGQPQICQDITGLTPLDQMFHGNELNPSQGRAILLEIVAALSAAADLLLPERQFTLQPSLIYLNSDRKVRLAFWPTGIDDDNEGLGNDHDHENDHENDGSHALDHLIQSVGRAFRMPADEINNYRLNYKRGGICLLWQNMLQPENKDSFHKITDPGRGLEKHSNSHSRMGAVWNHWLDAMRMAAARIRRNEPKKKGLAEFRLNFWQIVIILLHLAAFAAIGAGYAKGRSYPAGLRLTVMLLMTALLVLDFREVRRVFLHRQDKPEDADHKMEPDKGIPDKGISDPGKPATTWPANEKKAKKTGRVVPEGKRAWLRTVKDSWSKQLDKINSWLAGRKPDDDCQTDCQTVLLAANPADFRMALLSEGRPGTPEENEGLRAFILIDEFVIGRDQKNCDLYLSDAGIGRQHARILRRAGSFFICDLGSRNGTCLDGRRLLKNIESLLPDQCLIQFADRAFHFQAD